MAAFKSYESAVEDTWRHTLTPITSDEPGIDGKISEDTISTILHYATLAPSSHNTQCWKFQMNGNVISVLPDFSRRCPKVDPDNHHLFVSLGCAVENIVIAAKACGWDATVDRSDPTNGIPVTLKPGTKEASSLFEAIPNRHTNRCEYNVQPLSQEEIQKLENAAKGDGVKAVFLTDQASRTLVTDYVVKGNTAQLSDRKWVAELQHWIRFNEGHVLKERDGLYGKSTGSPSIPRFLGQILFPYLVNAKSLNQQYKNQVESSAGIVIFCSADNTPSQWVEVGRCFERFALQATALGISIAHLNQPVEVAELRPKMMKEFNLEKFARADLLIRFGHSSIEMPPSLRRPVESIRNE